MKKFYFLLAASLVVLTSHSQLVNVITESVNVGPLGEIPAGYTTYRVYALLQDSNDRISAIYGSQAPSPAHRLSIGSSETAPSIWNSSLASTTGGDNSCAIWPVFAETEFDSYVTIGLSSSPIDLCNDCEGTQTGVTAYANPFSVFTDSFGIVTTNNDLSPDLLVWDGTYLLDNQLSCNGFGQAPDNRVQIAQVTVPTGTLEFCFNIIVLDGGNLANAIAYVHDMDDEPGIAGFTQEVDGSAMGLCFGGEVVESISEQTSDMFSFNLAPNPAENWVMAQSNVGNIAEIQVFNSTGQLVWQLGQINAGNIRLSTIGWASGLYMVNVESSDGSLASGKLMVR